MVGYKKVMDKVRDELQISLDKLKSFFQKALLYFILGK